MKSIYKYLDTRLFLIGLLVLPFLAVVSCQNDDDDAITGNSLYKSNRSG